MTVHTGTTATVGEEAPDFRLPSLSGGDVSLSGYAGKRLVVFIWASW